MSDLNRRLHNASVSSHPDCDRPGLYAFERVYRHPISIERKIHPDTVVLIVCLVIGAIGAAAVSAGVL